jgi:coenzyme F420-dependent glucose-6-phosphate dehydrogenase
VVEVLGAPNLKLGYKASAEQFSPQELLDLSVYAEELGLDIVAVSDHFQPWRHTGGHGPAALPWLGALGQRTTRALMGTSVLTPTLRYHPSVIAHAFATLACLAPGRVFLGVGTGEAMNETPATGSEWPGAKERRLRLREAIELMRRLWTEERVTFEGEYYRTERATVYDRPDEPVPVFVAASGRLAAKLAGRVGDGFICTSGKQPELYRELLDAVEEGAAAAGREPTAIVRTIEIKVSYDHDAQYARDACRWWAALSLTPEEKTGVEDPIEMERLADAAADRAHSRFIVSDDPERVASEIAAYTDLGFTHLVFHAPGEDQRRFLDQFCADVVPLLR